MRIDPDPDDVAKLADLGRRAALERRRFHARKPKPAKRVMADLVAKRGYAASGASERVEAAWAEAAGERLARFGRPGAIRRGVLEVLVPNSAVMQELHFHRPRLLAALQRALPDARLRSLRLRVGRV